MTTTSTSAPTAAATTAGDPIKQTLSGIGVGRGSAVGSVVKLALAARPPADEPAAKDETAAENLVNSSFQYVATNLRVRAAAAQAATAAVLEATSLMAQDPGLLAGVPITVNYRSVPGTTFSTSAQGDYHR